MRMEGETVKYEWNDAKAASNEAQHGVSFEAVYAFQWDTALDAEDTRRDYGEERRRALGYVDDRLHVLVYTRRDGAVRVISLRKANAREEERYEGGVLQ